MKSTLLTNWKMGCAMLLLCATAIASHAQVFTTLANFHGPNGKEPWGVLVQGPDGNFYGTTFYGGEFGDGTVYRITPAGKLRRLYSFCGQANCADGENPSAGLALATDGNFYGTTYAGGAYTAGTVFKITPKGILSTLYSFCSQPRCTDGANPPVAVLVQATDGNFYGTTCCGGAYGQGTVFKITPSGTLTTVYSFCPQGYPCVDGTGPDSLTQATDGNFYGTTGDGGTYIGDCITYGCGTVFEITPSGTLTTLADFDVSNGYVPVGLTQGIRGNFNGATLEGGQNGAGTVFGITPEGSLTTLYSFCALADCSDGSGPAGGLVQDINGNFYGTTRYGGELGYGTVYELLTAAGVLTTLHSFDGADGGSPYAGLLQATNGTFYGTTVGGGTSIDGTVFSLSTGLGPFVAFVRAAGKVGQTGGILGQGFTGTTTVSLNGTPATFTVVSDTYIKATVPVGATSGYVTVTTPTGTLTSNVPFQVIP